MRLDFNFPPGDCWVLTRLVRDFAEQFPEHALFPVTPHREIFGGNPFFRSPEGRCETLAFGFGESGPDRRRYGNADPAASMAGAMYGFLRKRTGLAVDPRCPAPDYHLSASEREFSLLGPGLPVCVLNAGCKSDAPAKFWGFENYARVVSGLSGRVRFAQVGAARPGVDFHCPVPGAENLLGKTTLRELAQLVYHADFVLTGISQLHHLAGIACYKPRHCVTVAGGLEPENWANCHVRPGVTWHWLRAGPGPGCCEARPEFHAAPGCWRTGCRNPACMKLISPDRVIEIFERVLSHEKN